MFVYQRVKDIYIYIIYKYQPGLLTLLARKREASSLLPLEQSIPTLAMGWFMGWLMSLHHSIYHILMATDPCGA